MGGAVLFLFVSSVADATKRIRRNKEVRIKNYSLQLVIFPLKRHMKRHIENCNFGKGARQKLCTHETIQLLGL